MNARQLLGRAAFAALVPLGSMTLAVAPAQAQQAHRSYDDPGIERLAIERFNVEEVGRIAPGVELHFDLVGTPGGTASVRIDGANRNLHLTETQPGRYVGTYTIGNRDRIRNDSAVSADLRAGGRVASVALGESLVRHNAPRAEGHRGELAVVPRIERFEVQDGAGLRAGEQIGFRVHGTPGARVELSIAGSREMFVLPEVRPGEYSGRYTIGQADRIGVNSEVTATIRADGRYSTATLGRPLLAGGGQPAPQVSRYCTNCATVEAVKVVPTDGGGTMGTLGGAAVGGLLGSQVGSGSGRTAASVAGAVGGAVAGRNIERNARRSERYEVVVRYANNGATRTVQYDNDPGFRVGDQVRVNDGVLTLDR